MNRRRQSSAALGVQLGLIVTPMLDMSFQILAFFIMTYHPSALEAQIPGSLTPDVGNISGPNMDDVVPGDKILLPDDVITVKVKAIRRGKEAGFRREGMPSQIFIHTPLETAPQLLADIDGDFDLALARLAAKLKDVANRGAADTTHLKIAADGELRQQYVMQIYDTAKKAGFDKIHFVPPPRTPNAN